MAPHELSDTGQQVWQRSSCSWLSWHALTVRETCTSTPVTALLALYDLVIPVITLLPLSLATCHFTQACGREQECIATYKWLEDNHPVPKVKKQAADLRYIMEAPKLELSPDERVTIPLLNSEDSWVKKGWVFVTVKLKFLRILRESLVLVNKRVLLV